MNAKFLNESVIRAQLNSLDLVSFVGAQRRVGRKDLPPDLLETWAAHHRFAEEAMQHRWCDPLTKRMAKLLYEVTYFAGTVPAGTRPNYYQYTDARLLDWYLEPEGNSVERIKQRSLDGIRALLEDLIEFETLSLDGLEVSHEDFDKTQVYHRVERAKEALRLARAYGAVRLQGCDEQSPITVEQYARSSSSVGVLTDLMCVPLTQSHDEVVFIRVLQGSELCFCGIRITVAAAIEAIKCGRAHLALRDIQEATKFAQLLHELLKVLRTMPVSHFAVFRTLTGQASALQSIGFHLMDTMLRGVNTDKLPHFKKIEHLKAVASFTDRRFTSLKQALRQTDETEPKWADLWAACKALDRDLLTWRGFHLSFAMLYIPNAGPGTGGTTGAGYLRNHLLKGVFDNIEPDWNAVRDMFPELEPAGQCRIRPGVLVAP